MLLILRTIDLSLSELVHAGKYAIDTRKYITRSTVMDAIMPVMLETRSMDHAVRNVQNKERPMENTCTEYRGMRGGAGGGGGGVRRGAAAAGGAQILEAMILSRSLKLQSSPRGLRSTRRSAATP